MNKILFRASLAEEDELEIAKKYLPVVHSRLDVEKGDLIIGRYSVLPYYIELQKDIEAKGAHLINDYYAHQKVQDIQNWYDYLSDFTPKTWFNICDVPPNHSGSFVLKGRINSRKQLWRSHMFCSTRKDIMAVYSRLMDDSLIQHQDICVREFEHLVNFGENSITHCPISKEFRLFVLDGKVMAKGYYWSEYDENNNIICDAPEDFINTVVRKVAHIARFFVIDIAQRQDGQWRVIELGDAQMAGVSCCDVNSLYSNIAYEI